MRPRGAPPERPRQSWRGRSLLPRRPCRCLPAAALLLLLGAGLAVATSCSGANRAPVATPTAQGSSTDTPTPSATLTATATLTPSATPTPTFPADAFVVAPSLNLRAGPDTLHPIVDVVGEGAPVAIRGRTHDGSWLAVRSPSESQGWLSASYVSLRRAEDTIPTLATPSPPPTLTPTPVPIDPAEPLVISPPAVAQGDPVLLRLRAPGAVQAVGALGETTLPLIRTSEDTFVGMLGVPMDTNPGQHAIHVTAIDGAGNADARSITLVVYMAVFDEEGLTLDDERQRLLDAAVAEGETARLRDEVWSIVSPERAWSGAWTRPVTGTLSSAFGAVRSYNGETEVRRHTGSDFRGGPGTPVHAPARGRVAWAAPLEVRGNTVWLDHGWGVYSGYFHLTDIDVEPEAIVERGQQIGTIGATGRVTGPHLHWEVRVHGVPVQPLQWLLTDPGAVP